MSPACRSQPFIDDRPPSSQIEQAKQRRQIYTLNPLRAEQNVRKMPHGLNGINYEQALPALCREADEDGPAQLYPAAPRCWRVVFQRLETW